MTDTPALAEYTASKAQALAAARQRLGILQTAALLLERAGTHPDYPQPIPWMAVVRELMDMAQGADDQMHVAIARANRAAALCGQPPVEQSLDWASLTSAVRH